MSWAWSNKALKAFIKVTIEAGTAAALSNALWKFALGSALFAKCALFNNALFLIEVTNAVRASHGAELTTNAL
jgi:hypothetical protein